MRASKNRLSLLLGMVLCASQALALSPEQTIAAMSKRLENAPNISMTTLELSFEHGSVICKGSVNDKYGFAELLRVAYSTPGVQKVNIDALQIKPQNSAIKDTYITAKAETAVLKAKLLDDESIPLVGINAQTRNGVVTVSGTVSSNKAAIAIVKRITAIKGVKTVVSKLDVVSR